MYLDPGFGGMLIQVLIALVAAGGALAFLMRKNIAKLFSKDKAVKKPLENPIIASDYEDEVIDMLDDEQ
ncbi:MAG: hypothetical protein FWD41_02680 [Actinomycetia bacterium]|nr:hypothetical protein [Actinomycetes bacterium]